MLSVFQQLIQKIDNTNSPDVLITGLTHGNEVIGLQVINQFLEKIIHSNKKPYSFAILLNNVEAFKQNKRFIDYDLNRSFGRTKVNADTATGANTNYEFTRATEIQNIILKLKPRLIIDLHQTLEPTLGSFYVVPEDSKLIRLTHALNPNWPIMAINSNGFSNDGLTLIEYAKTINIPAFVIEISQNGYNDKLANHICEWLYQLDLNVLNEVCDNNNNSCNIQRDKPIKYHLISSKIPYNHANPLELIDNLVNLNPIKTNQIIGHYADGSEYKAFQDGVILFPKYKNINENTEDLGLIAVLKSI